MTELHERADNVSSRITVDPEKSIGADSKRIAIAVGEPLWLFSARWLSPSMEPRQNATSITNMERKRLIFLPRLAVRQSIYSTQRYIGISVMRNICCFIVFLYMIFKFAHS
jgi:hypothetical protein